MVYALRIVSLPTCSSQNSKLKTQNSKLKTQNSKLKTQNSKLKTQNSKLKTSHPSSDLPDRPSRPYQRDGAPKSFSVPLSAQPQVNFSGCAGCAHSAGFDCR